MSIRRGGARPAFLLGLLGCASATAGVPGVDPSDPLGTRPPTAPAPIASPAEAALRGWMPLASTGVPAFRVAHPAYDGRGVLIAILDSGVDPATPGLDRTSTGAPKLIEVRDFSGEGRIGLAAARLSGDTVFVAGRVLLGAGRLRALSSGPVYGGALLEIPLGKPPAADVNGNGMVGDTLPVLVTRASDGWVLLADTNGDGTLADEHPIRDYRVARETFGWSTGDGGRPLSIALTFADGEPPVLDLVFDTSGHGTHVAGIAAGHALYRVQGFDGVAPGAELLGLKIANDAKGGITVTGSMLEAARYAIRVARERRMLLVLNLSFGVGNEREGAARIDALLDSLLAANPDVVMTVSAGNDGPGLSTIGFPGTGRQGISVGASHPGVFLPPSPAGDRLPDLVAFFSARGGELALPDLLAPGLAYSTVPRWNTGEEVKEGTSMAAPHVAGLAASLLSGLAAQGRTASSAAIRRALVLSARPLVGSTLDQGAGQPDLLRAWQILTGNRGLGPEVASAEGSLGNAAWIVGGSASEIRRSFVVRADSASAGVYRLRSDASWVVPPPTVALPAGETAIPVVYLTDGLPESGTFIGTVTATRSDTAGGTPEFRLISTLIRPRQARKDSLSLRPPAGGLERTFVRSDSGRGLRFELEDRTGAPFLAFVHEPGGMPSRGVPAAVVGADERQTVFSIDGRDAMPGLYEVVAVAGPVSRPDGFLRILPAPVLVTASLDRDSIRARFRPAGPEPFEGTVEVSLSGVERAVTVIGSGSRQLRYPFRMPEWASRVIVELTLEREQWPLFTDFGLTLEGPDGRILALSPLNYAVGRVDLWADSTDARDIEVVLDPGFAEPGAAGRWTGMLRIRLHAAGAASAGRMPLRLVGGEEVELIVPLPPVWVPVPSGFVPLGLVEVARDKRNWTTEIPLTPPLPPIMP